MGHSGSPAILSQPELPSPATYYSTQLTSSSDKPKHGSTFDTAAYGGIGWQPRVDTHAAEVGSLWRSCGIDNEWQPLQEVLLHRPGQELTASAVDPDSVQMLQALDLGKAQAEHDQLQATYNAHGVKTHLVTPAGLSSGDTPLQAPAGVIRQTTNQVPPNQMFCADLFAMTPAGAILARPASVVRAGEEIHVARRLADLSIPIIKTLLGTATFEGADLIWINKHQALLGRGLRTNAEAVMQLSQVLSAVGAETIAVDMPYGTMHLMGMLRIVDENLAIAWPRRTPYRAVTALREAGYDVQFLPEPTSSDSASEINQNRAFNFVTLAPRKILMVAENPETRAFYESLQIECIETPATELAKAAGAVGCLTGVIKRG